MRHPTLLLLCLLAAPVIAQDELPAIGGDTPAVPSRNAGSSAGTTIIGERESPIGLYITPWRDARAEDDIDRPARLLQEELRPIDETVFLREVEYHRALASALKAKGKVTPDNR